MFVGHHPRLTRCAWHATLHGLDCIAQTPTYLPAWQPYTSRALQKTQCRCSALRLPRSAASWLRHAPRVAVAAQYAAGEADAAPDGWGPAIDRVPDARMHGCIPQGMQSLPHWPGFACTCMQFATCKLWTLWQLPADDDAVLLIRNQ